MKRRILFLAASVLTASIAWGQSTPPQTPPPGAQSETGTGPAESTMKPGAVHAQHHGSGHGQGMQDMSQSVARMQTLLDQMKATVAGMSGKEKAAMQANVDLWQMMIDHMKQMSEHMGMMGGQGHMMHDMNHMHHQSGEQPPATAPTPPTSNNPSTPPQS